jgi:phosphoserine aminotransferase
LTLIFSIFRFKFIVLLVFFMTYTPIKRPYNFSPGPAALPQSVLERAASEMLDYRGTGMSVMEMSHRSKLFMDIYHHVHTSVCELLSVPANYRVLFLQGGSIGETAIAPLNLLGKNTKADYVVTGNWSEKAYKEAKKYGDIHLAASNAQPLISATGNKSSGSYLPISDTWNLRADAAYVHYCDNETIQGLEFFAPPNTGNVLQVVDACSNLFSRPVDISRYGVVYASAQKNIGPAGLTVVIVRDDLLDQAQVECPSAFSYRLAADNDSMYNTPPTYALYMAGLVFDWMREQGGLSAIAQQNDAKAALLYQAIDTSSFYDNRIDLACRSRMNVPFYLADESLNEAFLQGAEAAGLLQLKGHKIVGGMRASLYNPTPIEGVYALVNYMQDFEKTRA